MKVGIGLREGSYTPEAYAYKSYLDGKSVDVELVSTDKLSPYNDVNIMFMGIDPLWKCEKSDTIVIHEYHSLSTPRFARVKDSVKSLINKKPQGRIFLNQVVRNKLGFNDSVPYIYRDMGVDAALFQKPDEDPEYDVLYCGSISGRSGLIQEFKRLSSIGIKLLVVGNVEDSTKKAFALNSNVSFMGPVEREMLPDIYRICRVGLNYTPDLYPFNLQTSTKTLEYLASGLAVLSNKYHWIEDFSRRENVDIKWLCDVKDKEDIMLIPSNQQLDEEKYSWNSILENCHFYNYLESFL